MSPREPPDPAEPAESAEPGTLSRLLEDLAEVPRPDLPAGYAFALHPGTAVGRFIIEREIGRGGFGVVYAALDPELGRTVALKLLKPGSTPARKGGEWLRREAEAVARLAHANIVTLHDHGRADAGAYLVFELLRGETLAARLTHGPLPPPELVHVALSVTRALAHAHDANVLHRDLKPANVFLCTDGTVKVLDFGIAHLFEKGGPSTGGTPAYMAPEQWSQETGDARTDLFALGVLLHEMATGVLPFGKRGAGKAPPGPPEGPAPRVPARLRRLIGRLTERDPPRRPGSTRQVLAELEAIEASLRLGRHPWRLAALAAAAVAVVAGASLLLRGPGEAPAGERITAAIADAENATGDPDLDRLADLLGVAFGESRRVQVLSRDRLLAGRPRSAGAPGRLDAREARLLAAQAGAHVLLVPSARRDGAAIEVALRGEAPEAGPALFTVRARADTPEALPGALDALVAAARRELRERGDDLRGSPTRLAAMTTSVLPAFREYVQGVDCTGRPLESGGLALLERCGPFFDRALAHDPSFGLAHYQLAVLYASEGRTQPEVRSHMEAALRARDRLSRRDAAVVGAWAAHLAGRDDEALAAYAQVLGEHPDDRHVLYLAGDLLYHRGDRAGAAPYFQAVLKLDPGAEWALDHLARALAMSGRERELAELVDRMAPPEATPEARRLAVRALGWLGQPERAVALARQALAASPSPLAERDLATALTRAAGYDEAEALVRQALAAAPRHPTNHFRLIAILCGQGRYREAARQLRELPQQADGLFPGELAHARGQVAAAAGDVAALQEAAETTLRLQPDNLGSLVVLLSLAAGDARAAPLAGHLASGSTAAREVVALRDWRRGDRAAAGASLAELEERDPWPESGVAPALLAAEVAADGGDPAEVVAAVERFGRTEPMGLWRGWAPSRAQLLAARAEARLGRPAEALARVDRMLATLRRADPGAPLVAEARALRAWLVARQGPPPIRRPAP